MSQEERATKRRKTQRACDRCRDKKLKCEYPLLQDQPRCHNCQEANTECEFVAPAKIDKRRLQTLIDQAVTAEAKQKLAQEIAARGVYTGKSGQLNITRRRKSETTGSTKHPPESSLSSHAQEEQGKRPNSSSNASSSRVAEIEPRSENRVQTVLKTTGLEPRMLGPTAITNLVSELRDKTDVSGHDGRFGLFRFEDVLYSANPQEPMTDAGLVEDHVTAAVIEKLVHFYADHIASLNPVILPAQVRQYDNLSSELLFSILGVAALHRSVPMSIFVPIRRKLDSLLISRDVEHSSTLVNIQTIIISCMSHELHGVTSAEGGSIAWLRIATAIRQSQDMGLYRTSAARWASDLLEERHRVWLSCIVADRWYACAYGQPLMIDLLDCDDPLRSDNPLEAEGLQVHRFQRQLYLTSCLLGDICRGVYRPRVLDRCTDADLEALLGQLDRHIASIPDEFAFTGNDTNQRGGLLNLMIVCVESLFFRNFVKMNRKLPSHITFKPSAERWHIVVCRSKAAIEWMDLHGDILLDCWYLVKYAVTYSALVQYYQAISSEDQESLRFLRVARDLMRRWGQGNGADRLMSFRAKVAEIVNLLYEAAIAAINKAKEVRLMRLREAVYPGPVIDDVGPNAWYTQRENHLPTNQINAVHYSTPLAPARTVPPLQPSGRLPNHLVGDIPMTHDPTNMAQGVWPRDLTMDDWLDGFGNDPFNSNALPFPGNGAEVFDFSGVSLGGMLD